MQDNTSNFLYLRGSIRLQNFAGNFLSQMNFCALANESVLSVTSRFFPSPETFCLELGWIQIDLTSNPLTHTSINLMNVGKSTQCFGSSGSSRKVRRGVISCCIYCFCCSRSGMLLEPAIRASRMISMGPYLGRREGRYRKGRVRGTITGGICDVKKVIDTS